MKQGRRTLAEALGPRERDAAMRTIHRARREVGARLLQASLFGSRARGDHRPDSDVDLLLIWDQLPPDREPQATDAERVAEEIAAETGVPVTVWSVAAIDLEQGQRTPMLVDALADGIPLWSGGPPIPPLAFTPADAARCARALLDRVAEGSGELAGRLADGDAAGALLRARDDLVRMCTAPMLLRGVTRPRRGEIAAWLLARPDAALPGWARDQVAWAATSYGADGRDEEAIPEPPPGGLHATARAVELLRGQLRRELG